MGLTWINASLTAKENLEKRYKRSASNEYKCISCKSEYTYEECLMMEASKNGTVLSKFFSDLVNEYKKERKEECELINAKKNKLIEETKKIHDNFDTLKEELFKIGIKLSHKYTEHINKDEHGVFYFNDFDIPFEVLQDKPVNFGEPDRWNLYEFKKEKESYDEYFVEVEKERKRLQRKLKIDIFHRLETKSEIDQLESGFIRYSKEYEKLNKKIETYEKLKELNPSQNHKFLNAINETYKLLELRKEIYNLSTEKEELNSGNSVNSELIKKSIQKLTDKGIINSEVLEKVFLSMDKVEIKMRRKEYNKDLDMHLPSFNAMIVKWFIENVYETDESFVERNYNLDEDAYQKVI